MYGNLTPGDIELLKPKVRSEADAVFLQQIMTPK